MPVITVVLVVYCFDYVRVSDLRLILCFYLNEKLVMDKNISYCQE